MSQPYASGGNWTNSEIRDFVHPDRCIYIYQDMEHLLIPKLPCLCGNFRRTSRALTQLYENALRPVDLRATQFTILQALTLAGEVTQSQLGEMLGAGQYDT
jgi:hypothetical protein